MTGCCEHAVIRWMEHHPLSAVVPPLLPMQMLSCSNKALCRHAISSPRAWTRVDEMAALVHVQQAVLGDQSEHSVMARRAFERLKTQHFVHSLCLFPGFSENILYLIVARYDKRTYV